MKKNKAFTLIELIAVLVILAIISLIVAPLLLNIIRRVKDVANKRSVDGYGRAVEYAMASYQLEHLAYPDTFDKLEIEYKGNKVECKTSRINPDYSIYLSECKVNGKLVKNDKEADGYYHYGILKMSNQEYVDTYGKNLEEALKAYHDEHNEYPSDYTTLELPKLDKEVTCDVDVNYDGTVYLNNCKVDNQDVIGDNNDVYVYGNLYATTSLLKKINSKSITSFTDGNTHEMYTFDHEATSQTPALTDYRYIGNDPYNYVTFNNELWRILGVFTVEGSDGSAEERLKIIKNEKLSNNMAWNANNLNEWSTATSNLYLNGDYYNELDNISKSMIVDTKYYLGGNSTYVNLSGKDYYNFERGKVLFNSSRSLFWSGKIALMYPSDYSYTYALGVDNTCYSNGRYCYSGGGGMPNKGWIYTPNSNILKWLLSPCSGYSNCSFYVEPTGSVYGYNGVYNPYGVRPTMYLSSTVKIISGDGTKDNAYKLSM